MYLPNKYTKWYNSIISRAQQCTPQGYTESHHIIPKCFGGDNSTSNLVRLTYREHRLCHLLLPFMVESVRHKGLMWRAAKGVLMTGSPRTQRCESKSRMCEKARKEATNSRRGVPRSLETIAKIAATKQLKRSLMTEEEKQKEKERIAANFLPSLQARKGIPHSAAHNAAVSAALSGKSSNPWTDASKAKMSISSSKPKLRGICPHCGLEGGINGLTRYHFNNCKFIK